MTARLAVRKKGCVCMVTHRDRFETAWSFREPDRVPIEVWISPHSQKHPEGEDDYHWEKRFVTTIEDFKRVSETPRRPLAFDKAKWQEGMALVADRRALAPAGGPGETCHHRGGVHVVRDGARNDAPLPRGGE